MTNEEGDEAAPLDEQPVCRDQLLALAQDEAAVAACAAHAASSTDRLEFEALCTRYVNAVRNVEFQNEMISSLVEQFEPPKSCLERRTHASFFGAWIPDSVMGRPKSLEPNPVAPTAPLDPSALAALKLDLSDRLTKRHFARQSRADVAAQLTPLVAALQMAAFIASSKDASDHSGLQQRPTATPVEAGTLRHRASGKPQAAGSVPPPAPPKVYSDGEVKAFLKRRAKAD